MLMEGRRYLAQPKEKAARPSCKSQEEGRFSAASPPLPAARQCTAQLIETWLKEETVAHLPPARRVQEVPRALPKPARQLLPPPPSQLCCCGDAQGRQLLVELEACTTEMALILHGKIIQSDPSS